MKRGKRPFINGMILLSYIISISGCVFWGGTSYISEDRANKKVLQFHHMLNTSPKEDFFLKRFG
ncbi:MAG: hypothetical protein D6785_05455, partial [Planctomycetota bacterium]